MPGSEDKVMKEAMAPPFQGLTVHWESQSNEQNLHRNVEGAGTGAITRSKGNGKQKKSLKSIQ